MSGIAEGSNRVSQQAGVRASHDSAVQHRRAPSSVLSTAELTGLLQDEVDGAISHEGIVLHDAPLLHAAVPASQPHSQGILLLRLNSECTCMTSPQIYHRLVSTETG